MHIAKIYIHTTYMPYESSANTSPIDGHYANVRSAPFVQVEVRMRAEYRSTGSRYSSPLGVHGMVLETKSQRDILSAIRVPLLVRFLWLSRISEPASRSFSVQTKFSATLDTNAIKPGERAIRRSWRALLLVCRATPEAFSTSEFLLFLSMGYRESACHTHTCEHRDTHTHACGCYIF